MTRYACRKDTAHAPILDALRVMGFTVHDTHHIRYGIPDAIICRDGRCEWLEIKSGPKDDLSKAETAFFDICPGGPPILAWSAELAIAEFERRGKC